MFTMIERKQKMLISFLISYLVTYVFLGLPAETSAIVSAVLALASAVHTFAAEAYFEKAGAALADKVFRKKAD